MPCALTTGNTLDCKDSHGGIKEVYIREYDTAILDATVAAGEITAWASAASSFQTYEVRTETAFATEVGTTSKENGTTMYEQTVNFQVEKIRAALNQERINLHGSRLLVFYLDQNGKYIIFGYDNGVDTTTSTAETGTAMGDFNGIRYVGVAKETFPAYEIDSTIVAGLLA